MRVRTWAIKRARRASRDGGRRRLQISRVFPGVAGAALAAPAGVISYGLAFWFYLGGLQRVSAGEAGFFINLAPIFALAGAYLLLAEKLAPVQWLGCGLAIQHKLDRGGGVRIESQARP